MVRPNGSVIGRDSDAGGLSAGPFIQYALQCLVTAAAAMKAWRSVSHNLCTMQSAYNPQLDWCGASNQRLDGGVARCAGSGKGDAAGAGAAAVPFGFFRLQTFFRAALGGGPAG